MSVLLWKNVRVPGSTAVRGVFKAPLFGQQGVLPDAIRFSEGNEDLITLPDPRLYRSLSRTGLLLIATSYPSLLVLKPFINEDAFSVGVYCAIEQGPNDFSCAQQMVDCRPEDFAAEYRRLRSAKQYLQQLPSVPPSQLSILLGIMGPQYVFQHSTLGSLHALDQAESDLLNANVQAAVVCTSFTLEEPLINARVLEASAGGRPISEGSATLVLTAGKHREQRRRTGIPVRNVCYGIAEPLITIGENIESGELTFHV